MPTAKSTPPAVRVAGYYRCSTSVQDQSIPAQRDSVRAFAAERGYHVAAEFSDDGISGDDVVRRLGFRRMIDAAQRGEFDRVLVWDLDRFSRLDSIDVGVWLAALRDAGVGLESVTAGPVDLESFAGRIMLAIAADGKNQFLRDLAMNVSRGIVRRVQTRKGWPGGPTPYGYQRGTDGALTLDPAEAPIVAEMFRRYTTGKESFQMIMTDLVRRGVPGRKGGNWSSSTAKQILTNPVYKGCTVWNRRTMGRHSMVRDGKPVLAPRRKSGRFTANDPSEWIVENDTHPAIVDAETFNRAQAVREERRTNKVLCTPHRGGGGFLFSGLITCMNCGYRMVARRRQSGTRYMCSGAAQHGLRVCRHWLIREEPLARFVGDEIWHLLLEPKRREEWVASIRRTMLTAVNAPELDVARINRELRAADAKIAKARDRLLIVPDHHVPALSARIDEMVADRERLAGVLAQAEQAHAAQASVDARIDETVQRVCRIGNRADADQKAFDRDTIRALVDKVECHFGEWTEKSEGRTINRKGLLRAVVYLRGEQLLPRAMYPELFSTAGCCEQLQTLLVHVYVPLVLVGAEAATPANRS